ncbi:MAG: metalloregulator ArsR/SmtB family transcription factor [Brevinematales bacterium]|nr:metalloregulator ArsR/SmtB family transcription factor [Brevinematales bacterium]
MKEYINKLKSLGDETRIRILNLLANVNWLYVCEIVEILELPFYSISRHLKELENTGIVEQKREGKFVRYFLKNNVSFNSKIFELLTSIKSETLEKDIKKIPCIIEKRNSLNCKIYFNKKIEREI